MNEPKVIIPTPEQEAIYHILCGFFLVVANAGSGKTTVCAELFVRLYLEEEKKLFPGRGHVTGKDQAKLLRLFLLVSFTKKAAKELDDRIHKLFIKYGVPDPVYDGKPARICRTIDSMLRDWLRVPAFYKEWGKILPALPQTYSRYFGLLPHATQIEVLGPPGRYQSEPPLAFFRAWGGLITEDKQLAVLDAVKCALVKNGGETPAMPLGGATLEDLLTGITNHIKAAESVEQLRATPPIIEKVADEIDALRKHCVHIERHTGRAPTTEQLDMLLRWKNRSDELESFLTVYDFARSRGWSPSSPREAIGNRDILECIANTPSIESLTEFMATAQLYETSKARMGLMDFGDYLSTFVRVITDRDASHLLEKWEEYPVRGIRRKYILMDENQDHNQPQFAIQKALCAAKNVPYLSMGVGDPFQSLYEFRGAHPLQFIRGIESLREKRPENLLTLSCCFRSGRQIVELGNEIIRTLSRHGDAASPSRAAKPIEGVINVPLPFSDSVAEATYIMDKAAPFAARGESVIVLFRANAHAHPVAKAIETAGIEGITLMSVHGSKGLEADHVFVAGVNAGSFPDVRCSFEQEVNCFYVACTRAIQSLTITCHTTTVKIEKDGTVVQEQTDPSPFFKEVGTLSAIALKTGWSMSQLSKGVSAHRQAMAVQIEQKETRLHELRNELKEILAKEGKGVPAAVDSSPEAATAPIYHGARASSFEIHLDPEQNTNEADLVIPPAVYDTCKKVFMEGKRPSHLSSTMRISAMKAGWLAYRGDGVQVFSPAFMQLLQSRKK